MTETEITEPCLHPHDWPPQAPQWHAPHPSQQPKEQP